MEFSGQSRIIDLRLLTFHLLFLFTIKYRKRYGYAGNTL